jgi:hypothetical protein
MPAGVLVEEKLGRPGCGWELTLKCTFKNYGGRVWAGVVWLRIDTTSGLF